MSVPTISPMVAGPLDVPVANPATLVLRTKNPDFAVCCGGFARRLVRLPRLRQPARRLPGFVDDGLTVSRVATLDSVRNSIAKQQTSAMVWLFVTQLHQSKHWATMEPGSLLKSLGILHWPASHKNTVVGTF